MKRALILLITLIMSTPVYASTEKCHELVMSYILADQDRPRKAGDKFYSETVSDNNPVLMETTAYYQGSHGSHGDRMVEGYAACSPEMYGNGAMVYEAIPQEDGTYRMGEYLDFFEIKDCGYGFSTGQGKSKVRRDRAHQGTIEKGIHLDVFKTNLSRCKEWMKLTNGKVFVVIIEGKG